VSGVGVGATAGVGVGVAVAVTGTSFGVSFLPMSTTRITRTMARGAIAKYPGIEVVRNDRASIYNESIIFIFP
jgi:hypothetical protein